MKIIGLTGGIASGKSLVSSILKEFGAKIIDGDIVARMVVEPGERALDLIANRFGRGILNNDGTLNRTALGAIVFNDVKSLENLNEITHPEIKEKMLKMINEIKAEDPDAVVVIDAALLIEAEMADMVDEVWLVYIDYDTQIKRLVKRDNFDIKAAEKRIKSQMPFEGKERFSDKIIDNSRGMEYTRQQVERLWNDIVVR
ncbi:dephospho-CoA kinase [Oxobacter pfennigii]|uniref:Dephospho-CoA kinase n=1 Tax=Oxobacter pfennigii TaxID=36849 RepID=A0A0P8Y730_9CLOT|nr:dephospho-CoA kinase [Oxobacter pfennigii]KPU42255.1 dephospho-CoA kinase [Oxobacter pfennigii]